MLDDIEVVGIEVVDTVVAVDTGSVDSETLTKLLSRDAEFVAVAVLRTSDKSVRIEAKLRNVMLRLEDDVLVEVINAVAMVEIVEVADVETVTSGDALVGEIVVVDSDK